MLSSDRLRLKPESIKSLLFLYYNKNITSLDEDLLNEENDDIEVIDAINDDSMSGIEELEHE